MNGEAKVTRLAEGTVVKGEVAFPGGKLRVEGEVHGNVTAAESVEIVQKGKIVGDILDEHGGDDATAAILPRC